MKTVKIFEVVEILDEDLKKHYFYHGGEKDGQPFHTEPRGGKVVHAKTPDQLRDEENKKKVEKISSIENVIKSHKETEMPQDGVQKPGDSA